MAKSVSPAQAVDEFTPAAWALILKDVSSRDADQALAELGGEQEWIHVSHIVKRVKRIRRNRVLDFGTPPEPPSNLDPDGPQYRRWLADTTEAIADGTYSAPAPAELKKRDLRELTAASKGVDAALVRPVREEFRKAIRDKQAAEAARIAERDARQADRERMRAADRAARETEGIA
jgi:hypothetical protein